MKPEKTKIVLWRQRPEIILYPAYKYPWSELQVLWKHSKVEAKIIELDSARMLDEKSEICIPKTIMNWKIIEPKVSKGCLNYEVKE
jgi:hypothetical protein